MSGFRILTTYRDGVTTTRTVCTECGRTLVDADDWGKCQSRHTFEWWWQNHPQTMQDTIYMMELRGESPERGTAP